MKKVDTLRRLIREAVLAEMAGWYDDEEMDAGLPGEVTGDPRWADIEAWLAGENVPSRIFSSALEAWFAEVMGMPGVRVSAIYFGGPVVLKGPDFEGGVMELELDQLADMFYGRG